MKKTFTLAYACLMLQYVIAQLPFSFTNSNSKFPNATFRSGNALSVVDMDGDGLDDIARLNNANDLYYTIQRVGDNFNEIHGGTTGTGNCWAMVVADVNNDGVRDVAVGFNGQSGNQNGKLIIPNTALTNFPVTTLPNSNIFFQNYILRLQI